uniref:Uncharacterized protein n=1 Tax=Ciona intestinalis TaxID=7719 RepID=F6QVX4_CIOIN
MVLTAEEILLLTTQQQLTLRRVIQLNTQRSTCMEPGQTQAFVKFISTLDTESAGIHVFPLLCCDERGELQQVLQPIQLA